MTNPDTEVLVRRAKAGDERSVASLLSHPRILASCRAVARKYRVDPDDLVSATYYSLLRHLPRHDETRCPFLSVAFKIIERNASTLMRTKVRKDDPLTELTNDVRDPAGEGDQIADGMDLENYRDSWLDFAADAPYCHSDLCFEIVAANQACGHWKRKFCQIAAASLGYPFAFNYQADLFDEDCRDFEAVRMELASRIVADGWAYVELVGAKAGAVRGILNLDPFAVRAMQGLMRVWGESVGLEVAPAYRLIDAEQGDSGEGIVSRGA